MSVQKDPDYSAMTSPMVGPLPSVLVVYFFADMIAAAIIHSERGNEPAAMFAVSILASQAMLLTIWLGLGNAKLILRLLLALAWCGWAVILTTRQRGPWELDYFAGTCLMLLVAGAPFGLLKMLGFRIVRRHTHFDHSTQQDWLLLGGAPGQPETAIAGEANVAWRRSSTDSHRSGFQFSIMQVFGWMLLVGVMATLARIIGLHVEESIPLAIGAGALSAFGLTTFWAVLGGDRVGARLCAPFGLAFLITVMVAALSGAGNGGEVAAYIFCTLAFTIVIVAAVLGLFRRAGFRVARLNRAVSGSIVDIRDSSRPGPTGPWDSESV